jgi:hypothetical protein
MARPSHQPFQRCEFTALNRGVNDSTDMRLHFDPAGNFDHRIG